MKLLALDCSAGPASCAVIENGEIKASAFVNTKLTHSQTLLPMVQSTLSSAMLKISDIDAFAINNGPGSFTGIRIGISAVKGLAAPENKPCIPVSTLLSIAYSHINQNCIVCAVMDARCNQVYNALFKIENGNVTRLCDDRALLIDEVLNELKQLENLPIIIAGDGADLFIPFTSSQNNIIIAKEPVKYQNACGVGLAAEHQLLTQKPISHKELTPFYLRLPQAERELKAKGENKQ